VHLERFGIPGKTLLGSDSHTPTAGGIGMLGIGAGGLDVAVAMGGGPFYLTMPEVLKVNLEGTLSPWVGAKDIILEVLRRLSVKGGVGKIIEYGGPGVTTLTVPERATITNMGAELGATSSLFPSDEMTRKYMISQGREKDWLPLEADDGALYDEKITVDLDKLVPMVALPHSPDNVKAVCELDKIKVDQVAVGSCTNSSYQDLYLFAELLKGKVVHPHVSLVVAPGSRQVYMSLARDGIIETLISSGARILETACGPCIGMGQAPPSGGVSVRTFNRNFTGRSGTADASVYLAGPAVAAAAALQGYLIDPRELGEYPVIPEMPDPAIDDRMIISPPADGKDIEVIRGPNIKPIPVNTPLPDKFTLKVLLHLGDNITTDHILPGGSKVLPLRSNIEALSEYTFSALDESFTERAKQSGGGIVVAGDNYGQGSSREHAALAPMHLGLKAVLAKSFARIHRANLVNFGILPLIFCSDDEYNSLSAGDELVIEEPGEQLKSEVVIIKNISKNREIKARHGLSPRQLDLIKAGGLLNYTSK
jgi:aconitate hydratase